MSSIAARLALWFACAFATVCCQAQTGRFEFQALGYYDQSKVAMEAATPEGACAAFASIWGWNRDHYSTKTLQEAPGLWKCQRYYDGMLEPSWWTRVYGQCQTSKMTPLASLSGRYVSYPQWDIWAGVCYCGPGTSFNYAIQWCEPGVVSYSIALKGGSTTKALAAGPALPHKAIVTQSNGAPVAGRAVTIQLTGRGSFSGVTDAQGEYHFSYVPPYFKPTVDEITATCDACSNTARKTVTVEACDVCGDGKGNPISTATGEKKQTESDWQDASAHPLTFTRHYRSWGNLDTALGAGWSHDFAAAAKREGLAADVRFGDGTKVLFTRPDATQPWLADNRIDTLIDTVQGLSYLRAADETRWQFDQAGKLVSITQRNGWTMQLAYGDAGRIASVTNAFGRTLQFAHDEAGRLVSVVAPDGQRVAYAYDSAGRLARVTHADGATRGYQYEDARWPFALTGITDESGVRFASFSYDSAGRAVNTNHAGAQSWSVSYPGASTDAIGRLVPGTAVDPAVYRVTAQVADPRGTPQSYVWQGGDGQLRLLGASGPFDAGRVASRTLGELNLPASEADFLGVQTLYSWDLGRQLKTATTSAAGLPEAQSTTTEWHPTLRLPVRITEAGRTTALTYDERGNKLAETITDTSTGQARTWQWTYNAQGLMESKTEPKGGIWRYAHDAAGNLSAETNPLGQQTTYNHDAAGRVLTRTAPGGLVTRYAYDLRGRLASQDIGGEVSTFSYAPTGLVDSVALPNGLRMSYRYDTAQRLIAASDNRGNSISYTLDAAGNPVREEVRDASGTLALATVRAINALNQVAAIQGAAGQTTALGYDANGEPVSNTDPLNQTTRQTLDGLRRTTATTFADNSSASQAWNALDQLTRVTDPKGVATSYQTNAFGEVMIEASPDIGTLSYTRDANGEVVALQDAKGQSSRIERDGLGRASVVEFAPDHVARFSYDATGNVSRLEDKSGSTLYTRDVQGRVMAKTQSVNDNPSNPTRHKIAYTYEGGELASLTYPSGLKIFYRRSAGRITGIDVQGPKSSQPVTPFISNLAHTALGQPKSWAWASGDAASRSFDADGRMTVNEFATYGWDASSRITSITQTLWAQKTVTAVVSGKTQTTTQLYQAPITWTAGYDLRNRLTRFARTGAETQYSYDANSNRLTALETTSSETDLEAAFDAANFIESASQSLDVDAASNRLLGFTQTIKRMQGGAQVASATSRVSYSVDANGAMTSDGLRDFEYDESRRLAKVKVLKDGEAAAVQYLHNALGQRVFKSQPQAEQTLPEEKRLGRGFIEWLQESFGWLFSSKHSKKGMLGLAFAYDEDANLIGEYDNGSSQGLGSTEYIWLPVEGGNAIPVGIYRNGRFYQVHSDHLGTPRLVTDSANAPVWQWPYSAFGNNRTTGVLSASTTSSGQMMLRATKSPLAVNLRFPGQYFDEESNLSYNYYRSYRAPDGRYTQFDPIGLRGGPNGFAYVGGNPLNYTDPTGLWAVDVGGFWGAGANFTFGYDAATQRGFFNAQFGYGVGGGFMYSPDGGLPTGQAALVGCNGDRTFLGMFGKAGVSGLGASVDVVAANAGYGVQTNRPHGGLSWFDLSFGKRWGLKAEAAGGVQMTAVTRPNSTENCSCQR